MTDHVTGDIFVARPSHQTLAAWEPFWDCVSILFQFQNSDIIDGDDELSEWRVYWIAGVALLRTVGHVLANVDARTSPANADAVRLFWSRLKSDRGNSSIFWHFIETERNNILKAYSFGARLVRDDNDAYIEFSDGSDAFQLYRQAVYWWRHQLMKLEKELSSRLLSSD